jgi:hypothetical protein
MFVVCKKGIRLSVNNGTAHLMPVSLRQTPFFFSTYTLYCEILATVGLLSADTDTYMYVTAAAISQKLCIKRKQEKILYPNLVLEEMVDCIAPLHCLTRCDANSKGV